MAATLPAAAAPSARAAVIKPAAKQGGTTVRGLDVSAYQHTGTPINWNSLAKQGIRFAAIKVSEGTYYVNQYYRQDAQAAAKAGLAVLPYVFANPGRANGAATVRFAVRAAGRQRGRRPFVVDLEDNPYKTADDCYGLRIPAMIAWIAGFTGEAEALTDHAPVIYTTATWWRECTGNTARFRRDPLWLAAFGGTPPTVPSPWQHWTFWQYNSHGSLPGVGQTDLDFYQPTGDFPAFFRSGKSGKSGKSAIKKPAIRKPAIEKPAKQSRQLRHRTVRHGKHKSRRPPASS